jgi:hypothetical protein
MRARCSRTARLLRGRSKEVGPRFAGRPRRSSFCSAAMMCCVPVGICTVSHGAALRGGRCLLNARAAQSPPSSRMTFDATSPQSTAIHDCAPRPVQQQEIHHGYVLFAPVRFLDRGACAGDVRPVHRLVARAEVPVALRAALVGRDGSAGVFWRKGARCPRTRCRLRGRLVGD